MAVTLAKGGNVSLTTIDPSLKHVKIGLGWDTRAADGQDFDLDASAFMLTETEKVRGDQDFIFYNNLKSADGSVMHTGDNRTGEGEGDDEALIVKLDRVAPHVTKIVFVVTIHDAVARGQSFGQVANAFIRLINNENQTEVARYDLSENASGETAMLFGELCRHAGEWAFHAVGQCYPGGLASVCARYGIKVA